MNQSQTIAGLHESSSWHQEGRGFNDARGHEGGNEWREASGVSADVRGAAAIWRGSPRGHPVGWSR